MTPLCFLPTGNCSRMVSYSAWHRCVSYRQETFRVRFPTRHDTAVFLTDRKLFAYSFLLDMTPRWFLPTGNFSQKVSYSAWHHGGSCQQETIRVWFPIERDSNAVSYRQETFRIWFPTRHDTAVFLTDRKLLSNILTPSPQSHTMEVLWKHRLIHRICFYKNFYALLRHGTP